MARGAVGRTVQRHSVLSRTCGRGQTGPGCTATDLDTGFLSQVTCHLGPAEDRECFLFGAGFPSPGSEQSAGTPFLSLACTCASHALLSTAGNGTSAVHDLEVWYFFKGNKSDLIEVIFSLVPPRAQSWQATRRPSL